MHLIFYICIGASVGVCIGALAGWLRLKGRKTYSNRQEAARVRILGGISRLLKLLTAIALALGLIWCVFFLILAAVQPQRADYANNMAELIVGVLTVISIIFAFFEFIKQDHSKKK